MALATATLTLSTMVCFGFPSRFGPLRFIPSPLTRFLLGFMVGGLRVRTLSMLEVVYDVICVGDSVMLYSVMMYDILLCYCMLICNCVPLAELLCLIGRDRLLWPRGSCLRMAWLMFGHGRFGLEDERCVSLVDQVLA